MAQANDRFTGVGYVPRFPAAIRNVAIRYPASTSSIITLVIDPIATDAIAVRQPGVNVLKSFCIAK